MYNAGYFFYGFFIHAIGAGVGDHHRRQPLAVLLALGAQIGQVDVAQRVALHHHHLHADHAGAGRVGAVRRFGNQADVALRIAAAGVPGADCQQPGIFALAAGVGLQADARVAGGGAQPGAQLLVQRGVGRVVVRHGDQTARRIDRTRAVLHVPADYRIGIVPASDTGAVAAAGAGCWTGTATASGGSSP